MAEIAYLIPGGGIVIDTDVAEPTPFGIYREVAELIPGLGIYVETLEYFPVRVFTAEHIATHFIAEASRGNK